MEGHFSLSIKVPPFSTRTSAARGPFDIAFPGQKKTIPFSPAISSPGPVQDLVSQRLPPFRDPVGRGDGLRGGHGRPLPRGDHRAAEPQEVLLQLSGQDNGRKVCGFQILCSYTRFGRSLFYDPLFADLSSSTVASWTWNTARGPPSGARSRLRSLIDPRLARECSGFYKRRRKGRHSTRRKTTPMNQDVIMVMKTTTMMAEDTKELLMMIPRGRRC